MPGSLFFSTSILVDVGTEYFHIDSPGEQQKIAILTAMGNEPDLLVLDEPVSSLDPLARRAFLKSLLAIARETDRTILFRHTSHQTLNALPPTSRSCMKARFNGLTIGCHQGTNQTTSFSVRQSFPQIAFDSRCHCRASGRYGRHRLGGSNFRRGDRFNLFAIQRLG